MRGPRFPGLGAPAEPLGSHQRPGLELRGSCVLGSRGSSRRRRPAKPGDGAQPGRGGAGVFPLPPQSPCLRPQRLTPRLLAPRRAQPTGGPGGRGAGGKGARPGRLRRRPLPCAVTAGGPLFSKEGRGCRQAFPARLCSRGPPPSRPPGPERGHSPAVASPGTAGHLSQHVPLTFVTCSFRSPLS